MTQDLDEVGNVTRGTSNIKRFPNVLVTVSSWPVISGLKPTDNNGPRVAPTLTVPVSVPGTFRQFSHLVLTTNPEETQAQRGDGVVQDHTVSESRLKPRAVEFQSPGS